MCRYLRKTNALTLCLTAFVCIALGSQEPVELSNQAQQGQVRTWYWTLDTSSLRNMDDCLTNLFNQYKEWRGAGLSAVEISAKLDEYLASVKTKFRNSWNGYESAYLPKIKPVGNASTREDFEVNLMTSKAPMGQSRFYIQHPADSAPGFIGGAVKVAHKNIATNATQKLTSSGAGKYIIISVKEL